MMRCYLRPNVCLCLLLLCLMSCATGRAVDPIPAQSFTECSSREREKAAKAIAQELDQIAEDIEDYGTLSASAAAVLRKPVTRFGFHLNKTPSQIFDLEQKRVEGTSRVATGEVVQAKIALALDLLGKANSVADPTEAARLQGQAEAILAEGLVEGGGAGVQGETGGQAQEGPAPTPQAGDQEQPAGTSSSASPLKNEQGTGLTLPSPTDAKEPLASASFQTPYGQRSPDSLDLPLRQLIQITFDDFITQQLFEWLSAPEEGSLGHNKMLFAAILNVSCRPGRWTYKDYVGEIDVQVLYGRRNEDDNVVPLSDRYPLSFAAFPGLDSQVLDLRTSVRRQLAWALALQAIWGRGKGEAELQALRRLEHDVASITGRNVVVGYNMSGRHFGWRFSPRLTAQADPADPETGPGNVLEPQTFPALVLILADKEDLASKVLDPQDRCLSPCGDLDERPSCTAWLLRSPAALLAPLYTGALIALQPADQKERCDHFVFQYSMRWLRAPAPSVDRSWFLLRRPWHLLDHPRLSEEKVVDWAVRLDRVGQALGQSEQDKSAKETEKQSGANRQSGRGSAPDLLLAALRKRFRLIEASSVGSDHFAAIPEPEPAPAVTGGQRFKGWTNLPSCFVVAGSNLAGRVLGATIDGRECAAKDVSDSAALVRCEAWGVADEGLHELRLVTTAGSLQAGTVEFGLTAPQKPVASEIPKAATLEGPPRAVAGKRLVFRWKDGSSLPRWPQALRLYLRPADDHYAEWVPMGTANIRLVPDEKAVVAEFQVSDGVPFLGKPARLEVDLRVGPGQAGEFESVLSGDVRTFVSFPDEASSRPRFADVTITFRPDGTVAGDIILDFAPGWKLFEAAYPEFESLFGGESKVTLTLRSPDKEVVLPLCQQNGYVRVPHEAIKADALVPPGPEPKTTPIVYREAYMTVAGEGAIQLPVSGQVTVVREKASQG